jgi:CheY-like chemotaxis protein
MPNTRNRTAPPAGPALAVLIVEDQALVAMEIEAMVMLAGHQPVAVVDDLASAVAAVATQPPDLALVDIQLAGGASGLDVAAELRKRGIAVVFVTGNCPQERGRGLALGCLHKPITDNQLAATIAVVDALRRGATPLRLPSGLHLY